ncbi:MAG TPA: Crp/Fnr family transcriptional regulator [Caulobacter sp.]|nr:Crp/Fnr family transcriptional regulator [Caulobacter sp.]
MSRLLIASLDRFGPLDVAARASLAACPHSVTAFEPGQAIVAVGDRCRLRVMSKGLAVRQHVMRDGGRQILGLVTPGDVIDLAGLYSGFDHEIRALSPCEVRHTTSEDVRAVVRAHPDLLAALCRALLTEAKLQRAWIVGLSGRSALGRAAHLFCEIYARQAVVALAAAGRCQFPASQADIAAALGLSVVHTHRLLQRLKASGLASLRSGVLTISDWDGLAALAEFDPSYFKPQHEAAERVVAAPALCATG